MRKLAAVTLAMWTLVATAIEPPETPPGPQQQEPTPAPGEPAAEADEDAAASPEPAPDADAEGDAEPLPPLPPDAETAGPSPERFNPTEKVRADFPVSFPIDI